jgi:outer membrane protein OmpA-like peptidoglycan-associated protein
MDGVADYRDLCPNTPEEARNHIDVNGCPLDSDGDGVYDYLDKCPNTPMAAYGMVDEYGCPLDTDGDGVADYLDLCPDTPVEAYGTVDANGCPIDTDKDGVYDYLDSCANTIPESRNYVDANGCMLDTDGDGVYDYEDLCPTIAGVKANKGCPEVKREIRNLLNKAMSGIQFETGKATIKKNSYKILNDIAKIFIENKSYIVEVQGHTDNVGKHDYNVDLSDRRAHSVRTYLVNQGVPAERLSAKGYGPDKPIADNETKAGRAKNRRVEFNITFEEVTYETYYDRVQNTDSTTTK